MSVWFTSDPHFGHRMVAGLRGFATTEEHDEALVKNWTKVVKKGDSIWVLGDIAVSSPVAALEIIAALPGDKHLIAGNHDGCHPMHRSSHREQRRYLGSFASVQPFARQRWAGQEFLLSHFPYAKDRHESRYMEYRLRDEGMWLLHGHTHDKDQRLEGREIHVGTDAWDLSPVSLDTILALRKEAESRKE